MRRLERESAERMRRLEKEFADKERFLDDKYSAESKGHRGAAKLPAHCSDVFRFLWLLTASTVAVF